MTKQAIIEHTTDVINQLPEDEAAKIAEFADLLIESESKLVNLQAKLEQMREDAVSQLDKVSFDRDISSLATNPVFDFLNDEEDLYSEDDLREVYGKR